MCTSFLCETVTIDTSRYTRVKGIYNAKMTTPRSRYASYINKLNRAFLDSQLQLMLLQQTRIPRIGNARLSRVALFLATIESFAAQVERVKRCSRS